MLKMHDEKGKYFLDGKLHHRVQSNCIEPSNQMNFFCCSQPSRFKSYQWIQ